MIYINKKHTRPAGIDRKVENNKIVVIFAH